jgi:hypothetical protein
MSFPTSPSPGSYATVNGILYQWNSTKTAWVRASTGGINLVGNTLTLVAGINSVSPITGTLVNYGGVGVTGNLNVGGFITGNLGPSTYEIVAKNLNSYPYTIGYTGTSVSYVAYTSPSGTITKSFSYDGNGLVSSVAITGVPLPHSFTKNLSYTGNTVTSVSYSII